MKLKSLLILLVAALMMLPCAMAEESAADTLLMQELTEWAARYQARALSSEPLNDPRESLTSDGYEFIYDFATLYADKPVMKADTVVSAVVVTSPEEEGPRGVGIDDTTSVVLSAFYTENPALRGSRSVLRRRTDIVYAGEVADNDMGFNAEQLRGCFRLIVSSWTS